MRLTYRGSQCKPNLQVGAGVWFSFEAAFCSKQHHRGSRLFSTALMLHSPQVDHTPHVGAEPHGRAGVGLVLSDEDGVRHGQQAHQGAVLEKLEDLRLVRQAPTRRWVAERESLGRGPLTFDFIIFFFLHVSSFNTLAALTCLNKRVCMMGEVYWKMIKFKHISTSCCHY